jgi:hypothetical protein
MKKLGFILALMVLGMCILFSSVRSSSQQVDCNINPNYQCSVEQGLCEGLSTVEATARQRLFNNQIRVKKCPCAVGSTDCNEVGGLLITTIDSLVAFKNERPFSSLLITGGTEPGHTGGYYSHEDGYKVDIRRDPLVTDYITSNYIRVENRGESSDGNLKHCGEKQYISPWTGFIFADEGDHWDILFRQTEYRSLVLQTSLNDSVAGYVIVSRAGDFCDVSRCDFVDANTGLTSACTKHFTKGRRVTLEAVANQGYRFSGWSGNISPDQMSSSFIALTMDEDKSLSALFSPTLIDHIEITPGNPSIRVGQTAQLRAAAKDATGQDVTAHNYIWSSLNFSVATVDPRGLVGGQSVGTAPITVAETESGKSASAIVSVTMPNPPPDGSGDAPPGGFWKWDPNVSGSGGFLWNDCATGISHDPPPDGGSSPPDGCWHWDSSVGCKGGWMFDGTCPPDPGDGGGITVEVVTSNDPNDKTGSQGVGTAHYITGEEPLPYIISFENLPTATAPAQDVVVTDRLDATKFDLSTLSLGPIAFVDKVVTPAADIPLATQSGGYNVDIDLRPGKNLVVRINASLELNSNTLTWRFTSINPDTGEPPDDPLAGFLPPSAEGSVFFNVMPKSGLPNGTEFRNKATIVFDVNPAMDTPEWINTVDNSKPVSHVLPLSETQTHSIFMVNWAGTDAGSGIRDFTVYVSDKGGPFTPWLTQTTFTQAVFVGAVDHTYSFFSTARDLTNNQESIKTVAETTTRVITNRSPIAKAKDITLAAGNTCQATVSANDIDNGSFDPDEDQIRLGFAPAGPFGLGPHAVTLTVTDTHGASDSVSATVTVVDQTPPTITNIWANPSIIWPADHKMVDVFVGYDTLDNCGQTFSRLSVSSNEPLERSDVEIVDAHRVRLRPDRRGRGNGRTYRITIFVTDGNGNSSSKEVLISVPHDQRH